MLEDAAPLLAAEGIDINDPSTFTEESLNEAFGRAVERSNFELFSPPTARRNNCLDLLQSVAEAFDNGDADLALSLLNTAEPEPANPDDPSISAMIGVGLGLLDTWHSESPRGLYPARITLKVWGSPTFATASDIIALAHKGRAFDSIDQLHMKRSGLYIFQGAALAVAATLTAWASKTGESGAAVRERALAPSGGSSSPRQQPAARVTAPNERLRTEFLKWYINHAKSSSECPPANHLNSMFGRMWDELPEHGFTLVFTLPTADMIGSVFEFVLEHPEFDFELTNTANLFLHYVEFLEETGQWKGTHKALHDAYTAIEQGFIIASGDEPGATFRASDHSDSVFDFLAHLTQDLMLAEELAPARQNSVVKAHLLTRATTSLLEWLGRSRPTTNTGALRQADIPQASAFLGLDVEVGPRLEKSWEAPDPSKPLRVKSMWEIAPLEAWWLTMSALGIIENTMSTVRPGPYASLYTNDDSAEGASLRARLIALVSTYWLVRDPNVDQAPLPEHLFGRFIHLALAVLPPDGPGTNPSFHEIERTIAPQLNDRPPGDWDFLASAPRATGTLLNHLASLEILTAEQLPNNDVRFGIRDGLQTIVGHTLVDIMLPVVEEIAGRAGADG